ncbi:vanadium-dependent haloperoxidase [Streptomyces capitiformicae]|uniref:PAP2 superfamily protein n=1 Tax=Streptomyces capitiformicae TaxID=2014920 RepID=A0A919LAJ9_9ACTN|nr:vanadium-dependent haloperoxidase [Streptomyces capitiformicae]GHH89707.1 hypothetical protein GCM10017771_41580 [Streptomyces capitiformicae]
MHPAPRPHRPRRPRPSRSTRRTLAVGLAAATLAALPWAAEATQDRTSAAPSAHPHTPGSEVISDWSSVATAVVGKDAKRPTSEPFIFYGIMSTAVYNAVVGIEGRYTPYKWHPREARGPRHASSEAAAATAARRVLLTYFPKSRKRIDTAYAASLAKIPDGPAEDKGVRFGERAAAHIVELRKDDGRDVKIAFDKKPAPGVWRPSPPNNGVFTNIWLGRTRPLVADSPDQFMPAPPPALTSKQYARDLAEVKAVGGKKSKVRTAWQTETARFFADSLPQQFQAAYRGYATRHKLDIVDAARLFAAAGAATADASITTWNSKYTHALWRPITAIRLADTDGNPATKPDRTWESLLNTPPYPEYIGGHCANDGAVMAVLDRLTGGDIDFRISSAATDTTRTYTSSADFNRDVINARVWGGVHFRTADIVGNRVGREIGEWTLDHYFKPVE